MSIIIIIIIIILVKKIMKVKARFLLNEYDDQKLLIILPFPITMFEWQTIKWKMQTTLHGNDHKLCSLNLLGSLCT